MSPSQPRRDVPDPEFLIRMYRNTKPVKYRRKAASMAAPNFDDPKVIEAIFTYHPPEGDQPERYQKLRDAAKIFAQVLVESVPSCADRSAAMRHLRECCMTANAAIALKGLV